MVNKIKTNENVPRSYGITLHLPDRDRLFISPSQYILGHAMLETSTELNARLHEKAWREGIPFNFLRADFIESIRKREGSHAIFNQSRRNIIKNAERYGGKVSAGVMKKSGKGEYSVSVSDTKVLPSGLEYNSTNCTCDGTFWADVKEADISCLHASALEIALVADNHSKTSAGFNITGLTRKERGDLTLSFALPLLGRFKKGHLHTEEQQALTDMIVNYFVKGESQYETDCLALDTPSFYTDGLKAEIENGRATFNVIRQSESSTTTDISSSEKKYHGSVGALIKRLGGELKSRGFYRAGYVREFANTKYENVAQRWQKGFTVYDLCPSKDLPPILVVRYLGEKSKDWIHACDTRDDHPMRRAGQPYVSVDDATRRVGMTEVIVPGMRENSIVDVPENVARKYRQMLRT